MHLVTFDNRDQGAAERLQILSRCDGVWRRLTIFNCTDACPRGIPVTDLIGQVKRAIVYHSERKTPALQAWGYKRVLFLGHGWGEVPFAYAPFLFSSYPLE